MASESAMDLIARQDWLERAAGAAQPVVIETFNAGGIAGRKIKDFLRGAWFGHPLHPALTDVPLGAWTVALVFDVIAEGKRRKEYARGRYRCGDWISWGHRSGGDRDDRLERDRRQSSSRRPDARAT
jgi:hypothetical protein